MCTPGPASADPANDEAVSHDVTADDAAISHADESERGEQARRNPEGAAYLFSLLTGYVTHMTDEEAQAALPDMFQNVEVVFQSARDREVPTGS